MFANFANPRNSRSVFCHVQQGTFLPKVSVTLNCDTWAVVWATSGKAYCYLELTLNCDTWGVVWATKAYFANIYRNRKTCSNFTSLHQRHSCMSFECCANVTRISCEISHFVLKYVEICRKTIARYFWFCLTCLRFF